MDHEDYGNCIKSTNSLHFLFTIFESLISLSPQLQDSYDCKSKREKRKQQILKNEIKRKTKKLVNCLTHTLSPSLSSIKFSKIGIEQIKKDLHLSFFSILWLSLSLNYSLTLRLLLFHARFKGLTCKVCILNSLAPFITAYSILDFFFLFS